MFAFCKEMIIDTRKKIDTHTVLKLFINEIFCSFFSVKYEQNSKI